MLLVYYKTLLQPNDTVNQPTFSLTEILVSNVFISGHRHRQVVKPSMVLRSVLPYWWSMVEAWRKDCSGQNSASVLSAADIMW